ncbi:DUF1015 family protein [Streptomyces tsukubensis]|uniref:Chromosome partitioning protein ParA n=1 Tax=Streptomyces tsukubensis TaxID=83656 RepID=A0A1V4AF05_9ACTN|nr:DUF1015 domain-containing protein [Streptomyces tsukubensis]OON82398.1 chromosome partitioning protein ParA [Streptomyces tsukubensis]QFR92898.1 DUF1015 family protein [Streptomyces tsukubensis]
MKTAGPENHGLNLAPFRGVRYVGERVGSLAAVTSPPYDVVVRPDGLLHLENADPYNIVRLILPQGENRAIRHRQAADTLRRWQDKGVLAADPEPALYVYEQRKGDLLQRGLIGALRLSEASEGVVMPHEDVMPHIVEDRADLMRATAANFEPLLLTYRSGGATTGAAAVIERTVQGRPLIATTTEDGFAHRLWSVTDPDELAAITTDLAGRQALIADGHHRWATYLKLRESHPSPSPWDYGLVLLVDTSRHPLRVRSIHRLLHGLPVAEALKPLAAAFRVRTVDGPLPKAEEALAGAAAESNAFLLAGDGAFHLVDRPDPGLLARTVPADRPEAWRALDATVLHTVLLEHVWSLPDTPEHIGYIHDTEAVVTQAERTGSTAVLMHPVREDVVRSLAGQGVTMPRKSTSFGPKPATGLVLRDLTR